MTPRIRITDPAFVYVSAFDTDIRRTFQQLGELMSVYLIKDSTMLESHPPRLVKAKSQAQAIRHVASKYSATPASAQDVADAYEKGVKLEVAGEEQA